jgi:uncharacterized protein YcbK (DUF882 family)
MKFRLPFVAIPVLVASAACGDREGPAVLNRADDLLRSEVEAALDRGFQSILARTDSMDEALRPIALLTGQQESRLRSYLNEQQLERARALGVPRASSAEELARLQSEGRLVLLEDSTELWIVRDLDHSVPLLTPDARAMLTELAERFQAALERHGLPALRLEVTSALRTAETQARLRESNPNAASGVSTHEYGTTLDVAYSGFAAPANVEDWVEIGEAGWLRPHLTRVADALARSVAARRSRELQAILGEVLLEMQDEGKVMVTLEHAQPVFHMTVARRY